ncbi:DUF4360 domain-containing protein [Actinomadura sp. KC06]|uniref:DUF4360 domain-containing protein n=1 Tax=Actinomadura sp. KC06 TaxID=2530369 RepID=UPI0014050D67|nr:DUF4360 domain-containing protein [Actinomadura sp. KC06]
MMNTRRLGIVVGAAVLLPALATATYAAASASETSPETGTESQLVQPPDGVTMDVVTVLGSGCPAGTARVTPSDDGDGFTVSFDKYLAWGGGDAPPTDFRKNCQLNVRVNHPENYTYAVVGISSRGFAHVEPGASAVRRTSYYFQGSSETRSVTHTIEGPSNRSWRFNDRIPRSERVYKPCGENRNLNINTEVRVNAGDSEEPSFIAVESVNADAAYHLTWRRC